MRYFFVVWRIEVKKPEGTNKTWVPPGIFVMIHLMLLLG
jgi:hypothetical protein